jgi:ankyrin repeat protein
MHVTLPSRRAASATFVAIAVALTIGGVTGSAQRPAPERVDFARDIQPLLRERCLGCHGPSQQMAGYRLDRRSGALGGVLRSNIVRGSSDSSRLYRRVLDSQFGTRMPPTGALSPGEIDVLKRWIDEGADWPDLLANEAERPAENPAAVQLSESIRQFNRPAIQAQLQAATPALVNGRGPGGATPLMYAALYGDWALVTELLKAGADPNIRNDVGATALMWGLDDLDKVRALVDRGADVNARSDYGRTPLILAAGRAGAAPVVALLLERGATVDQAALTAAAAASNVVVVRVLLAAGARDSGDAVAAALRARCDECVTVIAKARPLAPIRNALLSVLPPSAPGYPEAVRKALERGADVHAVDRVSRTPLMNAALGEAMSPAEVRLLIEKGADVHAKTADGLTAFDLAQRLGRTGVVDALARSGGVSTARTNPRLTHVTDNTIPDAIARSLPLLQRTSVQFYSKSGCLSCHHNALTAITVGAARLKGFIIDEKTARQELTTAVTDVDASRDQALQGIFAPGGFATTSGYLLIGLAAERHLADRGTDALVLLLKQAQAEDGHWRSTYRPPTEASEVTATAVSLRGVQLYGRGPGKPSDADVIRAAREWLERAQPVNTEDRVFRLLGLTWAEAAPHIRQSAVRDLLATQRADGGWAQLTSMASDAYATGSALVALNEAGVDLATAAYRRGVSFLLKTQLADGSWFVGTRSRATQIYFESGFPHGEHQFISAAATNWATQALVRAHESPSRRRSR